MSGSPSDEIHQGQRHLAETCPSELLGQMRRPKSLILDLLLERLQDRFPRRIAGIDPDRLERQQFFINELFDPIELAS
jgi:hypothetical protein